MHMKISSTRSQKCWIKLLSVVSGHEQDPAFLWSDTIKCIEKSGEGDPTSWALVDVNTFSATEDTINVFKQDNRMWGCIVQSCVQVIVIHLPTAQVKVADVQLQFTSNGLGERSFSRTWWPIKQVATSVRHTLLHVPLGRCLKRLDVGNNFILQVFVENYRFKGTWLLWLNFTPSETPPVLLIDTNFTFIGFHRKANSGINEIFQNLSIVSPSNKRDVFLLSRSPLITSDQSFSNRMLSPNSFTFKMTCMSTRTSQILHFRLLLIIPSKENGLPPRTTVLLNLALDGAITFNIAILL